MKKGLVGYIFDTPPKGFFRGLIWKIKRKLGLKVHHNGIPVIVSDKVGEDKTTVIFSGK